MNILRPGSEAQKKKNAARLITLRDQQITTNPSQPNPLHDCLRLVAKKASKPALRVFTALQIYRHEDGYLWPSTSRLQDDTKLGRGRFFLALNELEGLGVLDRRPLISRFNGRNAPTLYRIGGKIEKLPDRASRYFMLSSKKRRSQKSQKLNTMRVRRTHRGGHRKKTRGTHRGGLLDVPPGGTGVVPTGGDTEVKLLEEKGPGRKNHHQRPEDDDLFPPEKNNSRDENSTKATSSNTPRESYKNRIAEFKLEARSKVEPMFPQFDRDFMDLELDLIEARSKGKPISSANYFFIGLKNTCECRAVIEAEINTGSQSTPRRWAEPFSRNEIEAYFARNVTKLERAAERFPAIAERLREIVQSLSGCVAAAYTEGKCNLESLERKLTVLEENVSTLLEKEVSDEQKLRIRREMDRSLGPYRAKMSREQILQLESQYLQKRLFEAFEIPRLSLFYLT